MLKHTQTNAFNVEPHAGATLVDTGNVYMYKKAMITPSSIQSPSTVLLMPGISVYNPLSGGCGCGSQIFKPFSTTTLLCSIFLPVGYTSKTRESRLFKGNRAIRFVCLGVNHYLVVLYFPASACQSHPMYR